MVGIVDAAIIGRTGDTIALGAVALGASLMSFVFWSFGFLRMGVTGLSAQANGANDTPEIAAIYCRALWLGAFLGFALLCLQIPILWLALTIFDASPDVEGAANAYASARFWGAPALLAGFAINGWLLGLGRTGLALILQLITNLSNIVMDIYFVLHLDMGAAGVGFGTALAEWTALFAGLMICGGLLRRHYDININLPVILARDKLRAMMTVNADIMIRNIAILSLMAWFTNSGARQGDQALAANHILMQLISISAFILDAFAMVAEARVGAAIGAKRQQDFWRAIRLTSELAVIGALVCSFSIYIGGQLFIDFVLSDQATADIAQTFLIFPALIPILGVASWQLDGIFVGATQTAAMRTSLVVTHLIYVVLDALLRPMGNTGVWLALSCSYILRAVTLGAFFPRLTSKIQAQDTATTGDGDQTRV
jgi:MATE family multidrug resistance protein